MTEKRTLSPVPPVTRQPRPRNALFTDYCELPFVSGCPALMPIARNTQMVTRPAMPGRRDPALVVAEALAQTRIHPGAGAELTITPLAQPDIPDWGSVCANTLLGKDLDVSSCSAAPQNPSR